jgi:hypothetical protein
MYRIDSEHCSMILNLLAGSRDQGRSPKYVLGNNGFAPVDHMHKSFAWRHNQSVDDMFQLKTDIDVFNDAVDDKKQCFQLVMDLTNDIAEREEIERMQNRRKDVA